jgi:hypothetical protein
MARRGEGCERLRDREDAEFAEVSQVAGDNGR